MIDLLLSALLAVQERPSPPIGQRTQTPEQVLGIAPPDGDEAALVARADGFPLGSADNPVRVGGPEGERAYLARLRCADGQAPAIGPRSNRGTGPFGSVVAGFALDCGTAAPRRVEIVMDMYHEEHAEDRAPPGFTIGPR